MQPAPPLTAEPTQRRQIGLHSPWIFWRDHPSEPGRQGFACVAYVCSGSQCDCTEVAIEGALVDDGLHSAEVRDKRLRLSFHDARDDNTRNAANEAWCSLVLDFASGEVTAVNGPTEALEQLVPWLTVEVDEELSATLRAAGNQGPASSAPPTDPWQDWQPGDLMGYAEVFPEATMEPLVWGDRTWWVDDLHCLDRRCRCTDVQLVISRRMAIPAAIDRPVPFDQAAGLVVALPSLAPCETILENGHLASESELQQLWTCFCAERPNLAAELWARRTQMKALRPPTHPAVRSSIVGRNQPCPCGSGKKSKKCCGG